jgi:ketosteroid isomerase-like protein
VFRTAFDFLNLTIQRRAPHHLTTVCTGLPIHSTQTAEGEQMKTRMKFGLLAVLFAAGIGVSFAQKSSGNADEQAIRKLDKEWSAAAQSKDVGKTVAFYAADGSAFPFNAPIATGTEQIQKVWTGLMAMPGFSLTFAPTKIEVAKSGDLAYDVGTFELKFNDASGKPTTEIGKYVVVWKKQPDKQWKVAADIFNTDK